MKINFQYTNIILENGIKISTEIIFLSFYECIIISKNIYENK